ncbi:MAG: UDP-2,4-diacetamido-2,4,6-trideoxy-beta-L-altropyranose hydrolase [Deltaproteobacteria bacterium]|nr:UDP-2,4-diacetamido-2,4,6-trideoxy-beta-L-altropyranose hydrolase [Deltaproteobacteria bacterium]
MTTPAAIWIRADANPTIGLGHLMRCFALAQACRDLGAEVTFALSSPVPSLAPRFESERIHTVILGEEPGSEADCKATAAAILTAKVMRVVIDGYHFTESFQRALQQAGASVMTIDDNAEVGQYVSEWIFNQNLHADASLYPNRPESTQLLLGAQYVLLRRDFVTKGTAARVVSPTAQNILVTLGGGDQDNVTEQVFLALKLIREPLTIRMVVGAANPHFERLHTIITTTHHHHHVELIRNVEDMRSLMMWADFAITGAGSTCWEACYLGLPFSTIIVADNQVAIANRLDQRGAAYNLGWHTALDPATLSNRLLKLFNDPAKRQRMSDTGRTLIDGHGAERTARALLK